jgi:3-dehydroquinate synthase
MAKAGMDRGSLVLALGGGVVGDLAGLAASLYLRGVRLIQLPTTLLSMVDSSVGGKTGINIPEGKNLVGTFFQPEAVFADTSVLGTLHERDWYSGLAEVIKVALTFDPDLFEYLESVKDLGPSGDLDVTWTCVTVCRQKSRVVEVDERESGLRKALNFGHTLGHGIEASLGYGVLRHGEAVLVGMRAALTLSTRMSGLPPEQFQRAIALLDRIPVPDFQMPHDLNRFIVKDKKSSGKIITGVLIKEIGKHEFVPLDDPSVLVEALYER